MASSTFNCTRMTLGKVPVYIWDNRSNSSSAKSNILVMKSGNGVLKSAKFKYFRIVVYETSGDSTIQFTRLKFTNAQGNNFSYWTGTEQKSTIKNFVTSTINKGESGANGGESGEYGLLTDPTEGKCCIVGANPYESSPFIITYELLDKKLDIATYNRWSWYTANDTSGYSGRNMQNFELQVSNDGETWITVDKNDDPEKILTTDDWSLAYEHELDLSNI